MKIKSWFLGGIILFIIMEVLLFYTFWSFNQKVENINVDASRGTLIELFPWPPAIPSILFVGVISFGFGALIGLLISFITKKVKKK